MALLVGVDAWQMCRDFMNMRSREFRRDPRIAAAETDDNTAKLISSAFHRVVVVAATKPGNEGPQAQKTSKIV